MDRPIPLVDVSNPLPVADDEAMQETGEILSDKQLLRDIQKSLKSAQRFTLDQAKEVLRQRSKE